MQFSRPLLLLRQNPGQWRGLGSLPFEQFFVQTDTDVEAAYSVGHSKGAAARAAIAVKAAVKTSFFMMSLSLFTGLKK